MKGSVTVGNCGMNSVKVAFCVPHVFLRKMFRKIRHFHSWIQRIENVSTSVALVLPWKFLVPFQGDCLTGIEDKAYRYGGLL
jgi:hypothetical protein